MSIKSTVSTLAVLAVLAFSAGVQAAPATPYSEEPSTKIPLTDLKTGGDVPAKQLLQRIWSAANYVCVDELNRPECIRDTVARAVAKLDHPAVTTLYAARGMPTPELATVSH